MQRKLKGYEGKKYKITRKQKKKIQNKLRLWNN